MELRRSTIIDKNIVDLTRRRRNSDVARAIRRTRDRLSERAGNPVYDRELIKLHVNAVRNTAFVIPLAVLVASAVGFFLGAGSDIALWALVTISCYSGLGLIASRVARSENADIDPDQIKRAFLLGHFVSGLGWVYFAWLDCANCEIEQFLTLKAVAMLLVMAVTAIISSSLRGALAATFTLPVIAFTVSFVMLGNWQPVNIIIAGLPAIALPFLAYLARHLHSSAVMLLNFRAEKDMLIAELETAKAMSDEARRRAEEANLAKSRFLATMSHELRTPLNAILGFSEVMASEILGPLENPTYREYAGDIHASGKHLLHLINEILDLSRIEAGRYQLNEEPVVLVDIVEESCHLMELKARNKDIRIVQQFETGLPRLFADERSLRQITLNLLSNAVKFAPSGSEIRVRVGWTAGGGQYFSIKDNGPGIPEDEISTVLSAFGQGSIAIKNAEEGTGLGLPIVQGLLALHDGEFKLFSRLREGTEAIAILPPHRVMEELPRMPQETRLAAAGGSRRY